MWSLTYILTRNNIWYIGKHRFYWERQNNYAVIMPHLYCNHMSRVVHDTAVWYNMRFVSKINIVEANRIYGNINACDQIYWESESKNPVGCYAHGRELAWRKFRFDWLQLLITQQMYTLSADGCGSGGRIVKLVQKCEKICSDIKRWSSCPFKLDQSINEYYKHLISK